jgi:hypothetical protein
MKKMPLSTMIGAKYLTLDVPIWDFFEKNNGNLALQFRLHRKWVKVPWNIAKWEHDIILKSHPEKNFMNWLKHARGQQRGTV